MDIQVFYGKQEMIVELNVWRGEGRNMNGADMTSWSGIWRPGVLRRDIC